VTTAICVPVKLMARLFVRIRFAVALTMANHCPMGNVSQREITATCALAKPVVKWSVKAKSVAALTMVRA